MARKYAYNRLTSMTDEEFNSLTRAEMEDLLRKGRATAKRREDTLLRYGYDATGGYDRIMEITEKPKGSIGGLKGQLNQLRNYLKSEKSSLSGRREMEKRGINTILKKIGGYTDEELEKVTVRNEGRSYTNRTIRIEKTNEQGKKEKIDNISFDGVMVFWHLFEEARKAVKESSVIVPSDELLNILYSAYYDVDDAGKAKLLAMSHEELSDFIKSKVRLKANPTTDTFDDLELGDEDKDE